MTALSIQPPYPIFTEADGSPLENGFVYIGTANLDPVANPIAVFWDAALTVPAAQPIRTLNGYPSRNGTPARLYVGSDYSIRVNDSKGVTVYSAPAATERWSNVVVTGADASEVNFLQAGAGSQPRTVQSKLQDVVSVEDFGAVGNGLTDDTAAIQAAISATPNGGSLLFPAGTYRISSEIAVSNRSSIEFVGQEATIRGTAPRFRSYFNLSNCQNITFTGLAFDQIQPSLPTYVSGDYPNFFNVPIYATGCTNVVIVRCRLFNLYTAAVYFFQSFGLTVRDCVFSSLAQTQNQRMEHILIQTSGGSIDIRDSLFENAAPASPAVVPCGIFASGVTGQLLVDGNRFQYCGRDNTGTHRLGVVDVYGDAANVRITNNVAVNCMSQFARVSATRSSVVAFNRVSMDAAAELDYSVLTFEGSVAFGGQKGTQDAVCAYNTFDDSAGRAAYCVGVLAYDWGAPSINVAVVGNSFDGLRRTVLVNGPFRNVQILNNESRTRAGAIEVGHTTGMTSTLGTEANAVFEDLLIQGNRFFDQSGGSFNAVSISLNKAPTFTGTVGRLMVLDNSFRAASANGGQAISCIINASTLQGRLTIARNETRNYTYDWYPRSTQEVVVEDNRAIATVTAPYLDDGTNGTVRRRRNRLSTGATTGTVTLVGGAATVSTIEVRTGDTILLTRQTSGGTAGHLAVSSIVNATSFAISSSSGTDTSTVFWEIVH